MITTLLVIQKVSENGKVEVFQIQHPVNFQWTFEAERKANADDKEYFPFKLMSNDVSITKRPAGNETKTRVNNNLIMFSDDYYVPDGSVISILFPSNFIPDIIKFKDNPQIPANLVGQVFSRTPGQLQILYNKTERRCAVNLFMNERVFFGIKCIAKKVSDDKFPENTYSQNDELFDVSISRELLNVDAIKTEDLKLINETLTQVDLDSINETLNEILNALKSQDKTKAQSELNKLSKLLLNNVAFAGHVTKIADSYLDGGAAYQFVGQVLKYISA